jgi:hypothetical protein
MPADFLEQRIGAGEFLPLQHAHVHTAPSEVLRKGSTRICGAPTSMERPTYGTCTDTV